MRVDPTVNIQENFQMSQPNMQGITRKTRAMLERLLLNKSMSPEGLAWLIAATDPFHDSEIKLSGFPDVSSDKIVVQTFTQTATVNLPTGTDMHVVMLPFTPPPNGLSNPLYQFNIRNNGFQGAASTGTAVWYSGLNVVSCPSGANVFTDPAGVALTTNLRMNVNYLGDMTRLIACGWEVANITPAISAGGSVTAYRTPSHSTESQLGVQFATVPPVYAIRPATLGALPPANQSEAALYPNSRTWLATDGLYQTAVLSESTNPFKNPVPHHAGFSVVPTGSVISANTDRIALLPVNTFDVATSSYWAQVMHLYPYDVSGAIFTNSTGSTQQYQITVRYYLERVPTTADQPLLVLAQKPCPYDPLVLEIYSRALSEIPVGCTIDENPLGEWFDRVMEVVANVLPTIGSFVPIPGASLLAQGLSLGAKELGRYNAKKRQEELDSQQSSQKAADLGQLRNSAQNQTMKRRPPRVRAITNDNKPQMPSRPSIVIPNNRTPQVEKEKKS